MNDHVVARLAVAARPVSTVLWRGNIFFLLQDGGGESEFGCEGEAIVGGLCLGIYCLYCTTHLDDVLACESSQHSLQRLQIQILNGRVLCLCHSEVLFLVVDLD